MREKALGDNFVLDNFLFFTLFLFSVLLFFIRNPDPVFNPVVYAEDGTWVALALREGWVNAFLYSRSDYFVFLNSTLLLIATSFAMLFGKGSIEYLPVSIAFISYVFFALFATAVFFTIRKVSSSLFAVFGFFLVIMIPLGDTQNEIIGRVLQVGFYMPALAVLAFFWREQSSRNFVKFATDFVVFVAAATNPVVFVVAFPYLFFQYAKNRFKLIFTIKSNFFLITSLAILALATFLRLGGQGGVPGELVVENLIETSIARPILYPLIFPWYGQLSDIKALSIFVFLAIFIFLSVRQSNNFQAKTLILGLFVTIVIYSSLTIIMRPGLTGLLDNYQTTFPDRYFMGINILVIIMIPICLAQFKSHQKLRYLSSLMSFSLMALYIVSHDSIFEWNESRMPMINLLSFNDHICISEVGEEFSEIQIHPEIPGWKMTLPNKYVDKGGCDFRSYEEMGLTRPGYVSEMIPSLPLSPESSLDITIAQMPSQKTLVRMGILFGTYGGAANGTAELLLKGAGSPDFRTDFSLSEVTDNKYSFFDVPEGHYVSGVIRSLTGGGISIWESRDGSVRSCVIYHFSDGSSRFTQGCPTS